MVAAGAGTAALSVIDRRTTGTQVEDEGIGMPSPTPSTGRGVANMTRRVDALGGSIRFVSRGAGGTRIEAWLPDRSHDNAVTPDRLIGNPEAR